MRRNVYYVLSSILSLLFPGSAQILLKLNRRGYIYFFLSATIVIFSGYFFNAYHWLFLLCYGIRLFIVFLSLFDGLLAIRKNDKIESYLPNVKCVLLLLLSVLPLIFFSTPFSDPIKRYVKYNIVSDSNRPVLVKGDQVVIDQWAYWNRSVQSGDLILFHPPEAAFIKEDKIIGESQVADELLRRQPYDLSIESGDGKAAGVLDIKRCAAVEGDLIEIKDNSLYLNNKRSTIIFLKQGRYKLKKYLSYNIQDKIYTLNQMDSSTIPDGQLFVIGNNWYNSYDSRAYGLIDKSAVKGKFLYITNG